MVQKSKGSHSSKPVLELTDIIVTLSVCFHRLKEGVEVGGWKSWERRD